jgi:phosphoserine aminotransferase
MEGVGSVNEKKSTLLYQVMTESNGFFRSTVDSTVRSRVTVPFRIFTDDKPNEKLEKEFLEQADKLYSLRELKGHRRFVNYIFFFNFLDSINFKFILKCRWYSCCYI